MKTEFECFNCHFEGWVIDGPDIDNKIDNKSIYLGQAGQWSDFFLLIRLKMSYISLMSF